MKSMTKITLFSVLTFLGVSINAEESFKGFPVAQPLEKYAKSTLDFRYSPFAGDDLVIEKFVTGQGDLTRKEWRNVVGGMHRPEYPIALVRDVFKENAILDDFIQNFGIPRANVIKDKIMRKEPFVMDGNLHATAYGGGCTVEHYDFNKKAFPIACEHMKQAGLGANIKWGKSRLFIRQSDFKTYVNYGSLEEDKVIESALSDNKKFKQAVDMYVVIPQKVDPAIKMIPLEPIFYRLYVFEDGKRIVGSRSLHNIENVPENIFNMCAQCDRYLNPNYPN